MTVKATTEKLAALQREWKTIGAVPKKQSDAIWKRFNTACDIFFDNRKAATSSQRTEEQQNLDKKKAVIEALSAINSENPTAEDQAKMHDLIKEWNSIGHVPFKEKDKVYKQYKTLIDTLFDTFRKNEATKKVARYKESIKEGTNIARERERLLRIYENMCGEIKTYENNLGFLSTSSKSGNSLLAEMKRKMEKLKADADLVLKKIRAIEEQDPDLLLLGGDIFDDNIDDTNTEKFLCEIEGKYPTYYVTGNHEYWSETSAFTKKMELLEKYGVTILNNEFKIIEIK